MKVLKESFDSIYERVDEMIADIMPGIINKAMNLAKHESQALINKPAEEIMDDYREARDLLARAITQMAIVHLDENLSSTCNEDYNPDDLMYNMYLLDDVLASMMDNATDDEIDADIKLFDRIKRILDTDTAVMVVIDDYYNPDYISLDDGIIADATVEKFGDVITLTNGDKMVKEQKNGNTFLYFKDEDSAKSYIDSIDKLYMDEEIEDPYIVGSIIDKVGDAASNVYGKVVNTVTKNLMK